MVAGGTGQDMVQLAGQVPFDHKLLVGFQQEG